MSPEKNHSLIERFFANEMTGEEKMRFDKKVANDKSFAEEVAFFLATKEAITDSVVDAHLEKNEKEFKKIKRSRRLFAVIGILLLCALLFLFFKISSTTTLPFDQPEAKRIIAEWKEKESENLIISGPGEAWRGNIDKGNLSIAEKELAMKESQISEPCRDDEVRYYLGIIRLYHDKNFESAASLLECTLNEKETAPYRSDVPFHLIIAHAGAGNIDRAKVILNSYDVDLNTLPLQTQKIIK